MTTIYAEAMAAGLIVEVAQDYLDLCKQAQNETRRKWLEISKQVAAMEKDGEK